MRWFHLFLAGAAFFVVLHDIDAATARLANKARLDLMADEDVGELRELRLVVGDGSAVRMGWLPEASQRRSISAEFAVWPYGWRQFELRFTPERSGTVTLDLLGPWQESAGELEKLEIDWDGLRAQAADLANGSFEKAEGNQPVGWTIEGGVIQSASDKSPAIDGTKMARTWHDARVVTTLKVTAGKTVALHGHARAVIPNGFVEMARIQSRDTAAHKAARRYMRGVNLGNHLEVPPGEDWGARYELADLDEIQKEGFDHVRIPVGWHHFTGPAPDYRLRPAIFQKADPFVDGALDRGLNVILNIHHFDDFTSDPDQHRARFLAIWQQLSQYYADRKEGLAFELLNEPKDAATTERMNPIYADCIRQIRIQNPGRTIFVGPGLWNAIDELPKLHLPADDHNLIVTVHNYIPMNFTHQGTSWTGPDFTISGVRFPGPPPTPLEPPAARKYRPHVLEWLANYNTLPTPENPSSKRAFADTLLQAKQWSDYFGRPIHLGEFGVIDKADPESRSRYCQAIRKELEPRGIGWALWDWKAGFRYWDGSRKRPMPGMREGLFGPLE